MNRPVAIQKKGTIDLDIVETSPVVFHGRLWRFEYIRHRSPEKRYHANHSGTSYFRFVDVLTGETTAPFGRGLHLGGAFAWGDKVHVTAVENWGKSRFYELHSDDLAQWSAPRIILENPAWKGYNTSVCRAEDRFVMVFELGAPADLVGTPFTMFFAESSDLLVWKVIPDAIFGRDIYTGAPLLRWFGGWFYFIYLHHLRGPDGAFYAPYVVRSRDLKDWRESPANPIMTPGAEDRRLARDFPPAQAEKIKNALNINVSDLDMCEWNGKLYLTYSWGDQRGTEFLAEAEAACAEQAFCESFFE